MTSSLRPSLIAIKSILQNSLTMRSFFVFVVFLSQTLLTIHGRIHHLKLIDDDRSKIDISTFGYLKGGYLQAHVVNLAFSERDKQSAVRNAFTFILEKTTSGGLSILSESKNRQQDYCVALHENYKANNKTKVDLSSFNQWDKKASLIILNLDLDEQIIHVVRYGNSLKDLAISELFHFKNEYFSIDEVTGNKPGASVKPQQLVNNNNSTNQTQVGTTEAPDEITVYDEDHVKSIRLNVTEHSGNKLVTFKFEINMNLMSQEGLYLLHFYNCYRVLSQTPDDINPLSVNLTLDLLEKNEDSYLSAGEMPVPILYLTWAIIYFLAGISWIYILKSSKGEVYKIHYLMLALVFIKSISLTFHSINLHYIAVNGRHEAIWAILFYITYVLRGLLMIISILLVGTGWTFIKHILTENERRLFVIVVPLQILAITAYIFLEEKEEGEAVYVTWRQLLFLLDLICCGAILFPIVWSIKHLEQASKTDGKAAVNLKKLKVFKHFYIMVICYIYFTRIIGHLLQYIVPFRYEWLEKLCTELVTFLFFTLTAYKFQPAVNNPYLQLAQDEYSLENEVDYDAEMNEVAALEKNSTLSSRKKLIDLDVEEEDETV